jgi:hypothetical protein
MGTAVKNLANLRVSACAVTLALVLTSSLLAAPYVIFAHDINPGVFAVDAQPFGLTYGQ